MKCQTSYCITCVGVCREFHKEFVKECKEVTFFVCAQKHKEIMETWLGGITFISYNRWDDIYFFFILIYWNHSFLISLDEWDEYWLV